MSEYQYYEFQTVDRPLTREEQADVSQLSSRVELSSTRAVFTYQFGDFRGDPKKVLAQYFDAMLYLANWGSQQLMFRFPKSLVDLKQVQPYCVENIISFTTAGQYAILNIEFHDEEGGDWVEGEGRLDSLVELRGDILRGDYRALYLAWLKATEFQDDETEEEPPVPPGLGALAPALRDLARFLEIDAHLIQVAAQISGKLETSPDDAQALHQAIAQLSREECDAYLLRLVQGEPHLNMEINARLREFLGGAPRSESAPRRKAKQLLRAADQERKAEEKRRAEEAEVKRIAELESLFQRQKQTWQVVEELIRKSNSSAYQEAAALLVKLKQAADLKGQEADFETRLSELRVRYKTRSALMARLREAGLLAL
jgi:hypothetical protein